MAGAAEAVPVIGGIVLAVAGLAWAGWAAWHLRRADNALRPGAQPHVLVDEGPYRFGRNPMYLGLVVALLGLALWLGTPLLAGAALALALVVQRVHLPREEAQLQRAFGGWYSDYAATVRRWI